VSSLDGRVALITGASSGIGAATARAFVREGARVALVARRPEPLDAVAGELGDAAIAIPADVADPDQVRDAVDRAEDRLGRLDIAVNSAGVAWPVALDKLDPAAWRAVIDVNLSGSFYIAREAGLRMARRGGGDIVNVGSELSVMGMSWYVAYCASKAGVLGLTRALAAELAPAVRVNAICPGPVDTPMLDAEFETFGDADQARADTVQRVPLKRLAAAEEVAAGIVYLVAPTTFATGTALALDGGTTMI
jgi:NAD(P)-dependent dehydrogenase (short-subunit alcohol dehydrogenase family)